MSEKSVAEAAVELQTQIQASRAASRKRKANLQEHDNDATAYVPPVNGEGGEQHETDQPTERAVPQTAKGPIGRKKRVAPKRVVSRKKAARAKTGNGTETSAEAQATANAENRPDEIEVFGGPSRGGSNAEVIEWLAGLPAMDRTQDLLAAVKARLHLNAKELGDAIKEAKDEREKAAKQQARAARAAQQFPGFRVSGGASGRRPKSKPDADGVIWPPNFVMKDSGLWYEPPPRSEEAIRFGSAHHSKWWREPVMTHTMSTGCSCVGSITTSTNTNGQCPRTWCIQKATPSRRSWRAPACHAARRRLRTNSSSTS
jgi:hypothetical protein